MAIGAAASIALTGCSDFGTGPQEKPEPYKPLVPIEHYEDGQTNQQQTPVQNQGTQQANEENWVHMADVRVSSVLYDATTWDIIPGSETDYQWYPVFVKDGEWGRGYELGRVKIVVGDMEFPYEGGNICDKPAVDLNTTVSENVVFSAHGTECRGVDISSIKVFSTRNTPNYGYGIGD